MKLALSNSERLTLTLAISSLVAVSAHGNGRGINRFRQSPRHRFGGHGLVPAWLPRCFRTDSLVEMYACIEDNANQECLNSTNTDLQDIVDCIDDIVPDTNPSVSGNKGMYIRQMINSTSVCFEPLAECVNATLRERIQTYKPCAKRALRRLNRCARQNRQECRENCTDGVLPDTNPFSSLDSFSLQTCSGIETEVMAPSCEIMGCCQPCVEEFEDLMECVVNNGLNYTSNECAFTCSSHSASPEIRHLRELAEESDNADLEDEENQDLYEACLQYAPGLTGQDAEELEARAEFFVPCVYEEFVDVVLSEDDNETTGTSGAKTKNGAITMVLVVVALLFGM